MSNYPRGDASRQMEEDYRADQRNSNILHSIERGLGVLLGQPRYSGLKVAPTLEQVRAWAKEEQASIVRTWD